MKRLFQLMADKKASDIFLAVGSPINIKITTRDDLKFAEHALKALPKPKLSNFTNPLDDMWR